MERASAYGVRELAPVLPGSAGGCPPAPPQTRTSGFPAYGSSNGRQASVTTSGGPVHEGYRLRVLTSSPRRCYHQAVPFPTPRLPRIGSPAFCRYYETAKTTGVHLAALRLSRCAAIPRVDFQASLAAAGKSLRQRLGVVHRFHPLRFVVPRRPTVLPGSQRTPLHLCHTLRSRPNLGALPLCGAPVLPPLTPRRRLQRQISFQDSITWLWHSLSTLRAALLDDDARLASGGG
jgi:hypothetical protein